MTFSLPLPTALSKAAIGTSYCTSLPSHLPTAPKIYNHRATYLPNCLFQHFTGNHPQHFQQQWSLPFITPSSSQSINRLSVSSQSGGKRKRSTVPDLDEEGSLKRRRSRPNIQPRDTAMLQGIQASMNQFSDVVRNNNETTQHSILKDTTSKLTGAWSEADNLTKGEKLKFWSFLGNGNH